MGLPVYLSSHRNVSERYTFRRDAGHPRSVLECAGMLLADLAVSIPVQLSREMLQDFRYTLRLWATRPWHAGFAIAALAIGIGANMGVFSVVDALLLRSLPFHDPDRLALLQQFIPPHDSAKEFHHWRQHSEYLADTALFEENDVNLGGVRLVSRVHVAQTSWNLD